MLSLQGSIQPDPFSLQHVHRPPNSAKTSQSPHRIVSTASTSALPEVSVPVVNDILDGDSEEGEDKLQEVAIVDLVRAKQEGGQKQKKEEDRVRKKTKKRKRYEESVAKEEGEVGHGGEKHEKKKHKRKKEFDGAS